MDSRIAAASDIGVPFVMKYADTEASEAFANIVGRIRDSVEAG